MDERSKEHLKEACRELSVDPGMGKNLKGEFEGLRSYRAGSFRIVYRSTGKRLEVISLDQPTGQFR